jgi:transcriptional regulator with GAF, ATPase, and Fis domain
VELLAEAFAVRLAHRLGKRVLPPDEDQLQLLRSYDWPGNVRELQNIIERAIILSPDSRMGLERAMSGTGPGSLTSTAPEPAGNGNRVLTAAQLLDLERSNLLRALECCDWKIAGEAGAARLLGIPPSTCSSRMKALGIRRPV